MMRSGGLPSAYRRVEYLENSGTQYIATNYVPSGGNISADITYAFTAEQFGDSMLYGIAGRTGYARYQFEYFNRTTWYAGAGISQFRNVLANVGNQLNTKYIAHIDDESLIVDGISVNPNAIWEAVSNIFPMYLFAWNNNNNPGNINKGARLYTLQFMENETTMANYIPCVRKSDNKPGMYDTVSKTFYTNAGTGEFIVPA